MLIFFSLQKKIVETNEQAGNLRKSKYAHTVHLLCAMLASISHNKGALFRAILQIMVAGADERPTFFFLFFCKSSVCLSCSVSRRTISIAWDRVRLLQRPHSVNNLVTNLEVLAGVAHCAHFAHFYADFGGGARRFEVFDADDRTLWADAPLPVSSCVWNSIL